MKILVLGGTRFFGIPMVEELLNVGHEVTIATRGLTSDSYGDRVERITIDRNNEESLKNAFQGRHFDVVIDKIAYCSNDIRYALENISFDKYIYMSTTAVYEPKHMNTIETDFDVNSDRFVWCDRAAFPYAEVKRQAEYALWQKYADKSFVAVRYPFVIGKDDYTKRLQFYVEHTMKSIPMNIDDLDYQMGYIRSDEAGKFIAFLADKDLTGAINGCSEGTISLREIIEYVEKKTGRAAVIDADGDIAPYNGESEYSINTDKAKELGFNFSRIDDWIYELLDYYIEIVESEELKQIYEYQLSFNAPFFITKDYNVWKNSFEADVDGQGRKLFKELCVKVAYDGDEVVGFIQYGKSALGFDEQGEISSDVTYNIIRNLYFNHDRADVGEKLLKEALDAFGTSEKVYAFFHYFGMSCFARHGKLSERHEHIEELLKRNGFETEHENVYYSSVFTGNEVSEVVIKPYDMTKGNQQYIDFILSDNQVGGCEIHFLDEKNAYLRWIYVNENITGKGIGTKCMNALKQWLYQKGIKRLDTDTAISNLTAQHYYEKNGFTREGITRSYYSN